MSDRIIKPGGETPEAQIAIGMAQKDGMVLMTFDPPAIKLAFNPRGARAMAISLLGYADIAENPPPPPPPPPEGNGP